MSSDAKLELALRAANIGIWDWDLQTTEFDYSERARSIFGFAPFGEITYDMVRAVTHPDDFPHTSAQAKRAIDPALREDMPYEYRIFRADTGELRWVRAEGNAVFEIGSDTVKAIRYIGCIQDITDTKRAAAALEESERRQRLAIEAAGMAVWEIDLRTNSLATSPDLKRLFGFAAEEEPTLEDFRECYVPGEQGKTREAAIAALGQGESHFEAEFRINRKDGQERWLLLRAEILLSGGGEPQRVVGVVMDIDERKRNAERQVLLMRELNHRVKNSLSVVQSIAGQTFRQGIDISAGLEAFRSRLRALADANDILMQSEWASFDLETLIDKVTAPYRTRGPGPFTITGSHILIPPRYNVSLALALHELATNAAKYGALAAREGKVMIDCQSNDETASIEWLESGGPPVTETSRQGFGLQLLTKVLAPAFSKMDYELRPQGARCRIEFRL